MNNREIKFRAWDKEKKVFIPTDVWAIVHTDFRAFGVMLKDWENYKEGEYFYENSQELSQYTGLKDKNGKEIYEGDIVKWGHTKRAKEFLHRVAVVEINPDIQLRIINYIDSFTKKEILTDNYIFHWGNFAYSDKDLEIIGNIYENPELLNK